MNGRERMSTAVETPLARIQPAAGRRDIRGYYPASQLGRVAADGSFLDMRAGDYAVASAWRDPACEVLRCIRASVSRMVPAESRVCIKHGRRPLPSENPFPLEGQEWRDAETREWEVLGPRNGVTLPYMSVSFESCRSTPALEAARRYADLDGGEFRCRGLIEQGGVGCGKTTALIAALRSILIEEFSFDGDHHDDIRFYNFPRLSQLLLDEDQRDDTLRACLEADDLLIDDLGAGYIKPAGFVVACLEEIVIHREARSYSMLASTNLDPPRFRKLFGERVYDRLRGSWGAWVNVDGPSLRRKTRPR